jgi:alpha-mannosidase
VEAVVPPVAADSIQVFGPTGEPVPTQVLSKTDKGVDILFLARVPSVGFAVYDARPAERTVQESQLSVPDDRTIENPWFRVKINEDGDIASILDKANNQEVLKAPAQLVFQHENPSQFPAWNMDWDDAKLPPDEHVHGPAKIKVIENGPVRVAIEVERETAGSKFVQDIRLSTGGAGDKIEVANKIDWQTREHALKASFPLTCANQVATYDLQVGAVQRGNNNEKKYEVPQHQWLDLSKPEGGFGVGILNDGKYGSDKPDDNTVRLTMIYTPGVRGGYSDQATQDFGRHDILYAIQPHSGDWKQVPWAAKRLNQPLRAFLVQPHEGTLGRNFSLISTDTPEVEISALKKSEDGNEVIVRLRELSGMPAKDVHIIAAGKIAGAREVTGQELPLGPATVKNGVLATDVPAFSLRAFALKLAKAPAKAAEARSQPLQLPYDLDAASTAKNPRDGAFNEKGETLSAEQLPASLNVSGVDFKLGPTDDGAKNALVAKGQTIAIPSGFSKVYVLAASSDGDAPAEFKIGDSSVPTVVENWDGYIGQWDNRLWNADVGPNYTNYAEWQGLIPGYVKPAEVAWFCNHKHDPASGNEFYQYSYLYKYGFDVPAGASSLTLPNDPRVKVMAISVGKDIHDTALAAEPLYDQLADHHGIGAPAINPQSGSFADATAVSVQPPLYWKKGGMHYTTDGSDPTASSPVYDAALTLYHPATVKVAEIDADGKSGPVATAVLDVNDTTPPHLVLATSAKVLGVARVQFSEPVEKVSAENPASYAFSSGARVSEAKLMPDGRSVELTLDKSLPAGQTETLTATGVKDPAGNASSPDSLEVAEKGAVFTSPEGELKTTQEFRVPGLPVKAKDSWTLNMFCKPDSMPEDLTLIAGFGRDVDGRNGTGRYFSKFQKGINFWICDEDVPTDVQLDIGKWQMLTATFDGETIRLYKNGEKIAEAADTLSDDRAGVEILPVDAWDQKRVFPGSVRGLTIWNEAISPIAVKRLWEADKKG